MFDSIVITVFIDKTNLNNKGNRKITIETYKYSSSFSLTAYV